MRLPESDNYKHHSHEELLERIRVATKSLGRIPTLAQFNEYNGTNKYTGAIQVYFGGYRNALKLALGIKGKVHSSNGQMFTDEMLVDELRDWGRRHQGQSPTKEDFGTDGLRGRMVYGAMLGGLNNARLRAGLPALVRRGNTAKSGPDYISLNAEQYRAWIRGDYESGVVPKETVRKREFNRLRYQAKKGARNGLQPQD